jgi:exosome complex component RRP42
MVSVLEEVKREGIRNLILEGKRPDGRAFDQFREISLETDIISTAEGSCMVRIGNTQILVAVKVLMGQPYPDSPDKGVLITSAELVPLASPEVESGPPMSNKKYIEIARVVDRSIRESEMIDMTKMCVAPGKHVRMVFLDLHILDDAGNLIDGATMGALLALRTAHMSKVKVEGDEVVTLEKTEPLPVGEAPLACSVAKVGDSFLVDLTHEEELAMDSKIVFGLDKEEHIRAMQKSGAGPWSREQIQSGLELAKKTIKDLREKPELKESK